MIQSVTLQPAMDIRVWVLGGCVTLLVPCLAYFLVREFKRKDDLSAEVKLLATKVTTSIEELNKAVATLSLTISEIRVWSQDRFVTRGEHQEAIEQVKADIATHAARWERDLERCQDRCGGER